MSSDLATLMPVYMLES